MPHLLIIIPSTAFLLWTMAIQWSNFYPSQQGNIIICTCCTWNITGYTHSTNCNRLASNESCLVYDLLYLLGQLPSELWMECCSSAISSAWSGLDPIRRLQLSQFTNWCCVVWINQVYWDIEYWFYVYVTYHNSTLVGVFCWTLLLLWKFFQLSCTHTFLACTHQML